MNPEDLSPELIEKARACKTGEELSALAAEVGVELSDEQLEAVSGGSWATDCPKEDCSDYQPDVQCNHGGCNHFSCYNDGMF